MPIAAIGKSVYNTFKPEEQTKQGDSKKTTITSPAHPDMTRFMKAVNSEDLARPNLFLVRFDNFFNVGYDGNELKLVGSNNTNGVQNNADYTIDKISEVATNQIVQTELGGAIMGAYNPSLLSPVLSSVPMLANLIPKGFDPNKELAMLVKSVNFPGSSFNTKKVYMYKTPMTSVNGRSVDTLRLTFFMTPNQVEREIMMMWMNMVHDPVKNSYGMYDDYTKLIDVYPLNRQAIPMSVTQCNKCFPIKVSEVQYDVNKNNEVATFEVEFAVSFVETKSFKGESPFIDKAASVIENVATNPLVSGLF